MSSCACSVSLAWTARNAAWHEEFKEAEEDLLLVQNERYTSDYAYLSWLARCYIANGKPKVLHESRSPVAAWCCCAMWLLG